MKKILAFFIVFISFISCSNMEEKRELNYHSRKGYAHTHLTVLERSNDLLELEVQIMDQSKEIILLNRKDKGFYSSENIDFKFLENGDVELVYRGEKIVLSEIKYRNNEGFGHKVYKDSYEGHGH